MVGLVVLIDHAIALEGRVALEVPVAGQRCERDVVGHVEIDPQRGRVEGVVSLGGLAVVVQAVREVDRFPSTIDAAREVRRCASGSVHARAPVGRAVVVGRERIGRHQRPFRDVGVARDQRAQLVHLVERPETEELRHLRIAAIEEPAHREECAERVARLPQERAAHVVELLVAVLGVAAIAAAILSPVVVRGQSRVGRVALLPRAGIEHAPCEPGAQRLGQRPAHEGGDVRRVEAAIAHVEASFELLARLVRDVVDRAAGRVLAEQRALRALQRFYALQIEARALRHDCELQRHFVEVDADRRAGSERGVLEADAADREDGRAVVRDAVVEASHDLVELRGVGHTEFGELVARHGRDRHADLVEVLLALLRGHDDFFDATAGGLGCCLGCRRGRRGFLRKRGREGRDQKNQRAAARQERSHDGFPLIRPPFRVPVRNAGSPARAAKSIA